MFSTRFFFEFYSFGHFSISRHRTLCPEDCPDLLGPPSRKAWTPPPSPAEPPRRPLGQARVLAPGSEITPWNSHARSADSLGGPRWGPGKFPHAWASFLELGDLYKRNANKIVAYLYNSQLAWTFKENHDWFLKLFRKNKIHETSMFCSGDLEDDHRIDINH